MKLDTTTAREFHDWLKGKMADRDYLFQELSSTHSMIYGTGSAQLYVLAMQAMIHASIESGQYGLICSLPQEGLEQVIAVFRDGDYHKSKTIFTQVSNFWLSKLGSYSMAATKAEKGATLEATRTPSSDVDELKKAKQAGQTALQKIYKQPSIGSFYQRFSESPFNLKDVIDGGEQYFVDSGAKAREQTTRGKPMAMSDLINDAAVRRACKFLLYEAIREKRRIVYLLDDLDLGKVAYLSGKAGRIPDDARIAGGKSNNKVPICTTEIREIFRNWDYFKDHLKFYLNFRECLPPWDAYHGHASKWAEYANHRATSLIQASPPNMKLTHKNWLEMCKVNYEVRPEAAIESFHKARPSLYTKGASLHSTSSAPETL